MKKSVLFSLFVIGYIGISYAQCVPNSTYTTSGYYTNKSTKKDTAFIGEAYNQIITIVVPTDTLINKSIPATIDSMVLKGITNKPSTITYNCNNARCKILGGGNGCLQLIGTPVIANAGTYKLKLSLIIYGKAPMLSNMPVSMPITDSSFTLVVMSRPTPTGIEERTGVYSLKNVPNPFSSETNIEFYAVNAEKYDFVVYDVYGKMVFTDKINATAGENTYTFNANNMANGIYSYSLRNINGAQTQRMMIVK